MDQLAAMRAFIKVVDGGSFTKASELLSVPTSTVSKQIQELERYLRVKLLLRTTRRVSVTPEGVLYYEKAMRILGELEETDMGFRASQVTPRGRLRIDMGGSIATCVLIPALPEFLARFPEIEIDVGVSDRMVDLISDNVDCVIRGGEVGDPSLVARAIGTTAWVTCASPAYLAQYGVPQHPDDLRHQHRIAAYLSTLTKRAVPLRYSKGDERIEVAPGSIVRINESNGHVAAALAGLGVIQTFSYMVNAHIATGALVPFLQDWRPEPYPFYAVFTSNRYVSNRQRVFIDWLVERFPSMLV